ncbi:hypothetical protein KA082_00620 [Candidatus Woesebacteria bacterium]|nr:hypothetical protein [Candidatus Woesebacteria bacterium]
MRHEAAILAYIPVLHQGYYSFFTAHKTAKTLYILDAKVAQEFTPVHKDIHGLEHTLVQQAITSWRLFDEVIITDSATLSHINQKKIDLIIPDEEVTREVTQKYTPQCDITTSSIFLRWDRNSAAAEVTPHPTTTISSSEVDKTFAKLAVVEGEKSSDWWRHVGAVAIQNGVVIAQAHNTHLPSEQTPYAEGDARAHFHKGDHIELTTAIHAESKLIAQAAACGLSLSGADLYVTDFPCPPCAKLIAHSGIRRLFYQKGYSMLDGERVLHTAGVEIIAITE